MLIAVCLIVVGCHSAPQAESITDLVEPLPSKPSDMFVFDSEQYPAVFEAAVETLRNHGYRIARRDYRFGAITTYPKEAATAAEFWIDDATTREQRHADTLNAQQRTVTVKVERNMSEAAFEDALQSTNKPDDIRSDNPDFWSYRLSVEVRIQRLQRPDRYLTHSASPRISRTYTDTPMHLKDRGIQGPYAQETGRDSLLERRLLQAIQDNLPD